MKSSARASLGFSGSPVQDEIGLDPVGPKDVAERFAPDHPAFAVGVFRVGLAVAIAPDFGGKLLHFLVALRIVLQPGGFLRLRPDHRRTVANQLPDLLEHFQRHGRGGRGGNRLLDAAADDVADFPRSRGAILQHQQAIAHAVGQHDPAILDRHPRQQHFGVAVVAVVTAQGRVVLFERSDDRRIFAQIETHVANEQSLLQQELATREIREERRRTAPTT